MNNNFIKTSKLGELSNKMNAQKKYCWNLFEFYNARIESIVQHSAFWTTKECNESNLRNASLTNANFKLKQNFCGHMV